MLSCIHDPGLALFLAEPQRSPDEGTPASGHVVGCLLLAGFVISALAAGMMGGLLS